jgi:hypothetical protein
MGSISRQTNAINNARASKGEKPYGVFCVGHLHCGTLVHLPGGTLIINGALIPPDGYAMSIGILNSNCGQWLFESTSGHAIGDSRFMEVDVHTDADKSLDKIIKPFQDF